MDFPITELMDREACIQWLEKYFHPDGLKCPHCQVGVEQAIWFRKTKKSDLDVYRCKNCRGIYNPHEDIASRVIGKIFKTAEKIWKQERRCFGGHEGAPRGVFVAYRDKSNTYYPLTYKAA
ncbi:MAG: hypothetical protein AB1750_11290 [Chloroflexota bacterium]